MDEIELLRATRPAAPPYPDAARAAARATLLSPSAHKAHARGTYGRGLPAARRSRNRFLAAGVAATTSLAAAVGLAAVVEQAGDTNGAGKDGHVLWPGRSPSGMVVNAAQVLSLAANTVEAQPAIRPRAHQWAYIKEIHHPGRPRVAVVGPQATTYSAPTVMETWTRFDGTRKASLGGFQGYSPLDADPGRLRITTLDHDADETTPLQDYRYLASLPTDPEALVNTLCRYRPAPSDRTSCVFSISHKLLRNAAIPPKLQATFYRALARLPHIIVKRDVLDLAGRPSIAVAEAFPNDFQSQEILLDPHTYKYRGERLNWTVDPNEAPPAPGREPPRVLVSPTDARARHEFTATTRIDTGIVDWPGQRP